MLRYWKGGQQMDDIKIDEKAVNRLIKKIIIQENKNLKSRTMNDGQMVKWIKDKIKEEAECYSNR